MELSKRLKIERYENEDGDVVFTEKYLIQRGSCCGYGCIHCPYQPKHKAGNTVVAPELRTYIKSSRYDNE
ncbi:MAG: hypothetical protein JRF53_15555 [Deltaproteobacteria bacterium]|nr:hypothetical protein [Deltaproteobacteria bacterium]